MQLGFIIDYFIAMCIMIGKKTSWKNGKHSETLSDNPTNKLLDFDPPLVHGFAVEDNDDEAAIVG